jgi:hypothetical protein
MASPPQRGERAKARPSGGGEVRAADATATDPVPKAPMRPVPRSGPVPTIRPAQNQPAPVGNRAVRHRPRHRPPHPARASPEVLGPLAGLVPSRVAATSKSPRPRGRAGHRSRPPRPTPRYRLESLRSATPGRLQSVLGVGSTDLPPLTPAGTGPNASGVGVDVAGVVPVPVPEALSISR